MAQVRCEVTGVFVAAGESAAAPLVLLADSSGRKLPIFIGISEAIAINSALHRETLPRPFTHDLFIDLITRFSIALSSLRIDSLQDGVYYAQLVLRDETREEDIDCRPSDGIAIALRAFVPIYVEEGLLPEAGKAAELPALVSLSAFLTR
ncbi:MAG TPA: bifunctional nuclease family protein [Methanoregula sp.]|nr:bifunctional nuclease family protein [Methanoregula sp.]